LLALLPYFISCSSAPAINANRAFTELVFIDHINLRYVEGGEQAKEEIKHAKRNIDEAARYGVHSYLLFAKESMEAILTYDFEVPGKDLFFSVDKEIFESKLDELSKNLSNKSDTEIVLSLQQIIAEMGDLISKFLTAYLSTTTVWFRFGAVTGKKIF
jgi:hypothetical protein